MNRSIRPALALLVSCSLLACQTGIEPGARAPNAPAGRAPPAEHAGATASARPCPLPEGDALCAINAVFLDAYVRRRDAALAGAGPLILQIGDSLVLLRGGERLVGPAISARYHELKSVAHVTFALYLMLEPVDGALGEPLSRELAAYRKLVDGAAGSVEGRFAGAAQRERQRRILARAAAFLDGILSRGRMDAAELRAFVKAERADVLENILDAARDQVTTMHATVEGWKTRMSPDELAQLKVVISTVHMARTGNLAVQYFQAALGEPSGGGRADERLSVEARVFVAENMFDEERSRALLGSHLVDRAAAAVFFDDPLRLDRDLLSDAAEAAVREVFPSNRTREKD